MSQETDIRLTSDEFRVALAGIIQFKQNRKVDPAEIAGLSIIDRSGSKEEFMAVVADDLDKYEIEIIMDLDFQPSEEQPEPVEVAAVLERPAAPVAAPVQVAVADSQMSVHRQNAQRLLASLQAKG